MEIREILLNRSSVSRYSDQRVNRQQLQRILQVAGNISGVAQQQIIRFMMIEDEASRHGLEQACRQQLTQQASSDEVNGHQAGLEDSFDRHDIEAVQEAPCVLCILGETDKPAWSQLGWRAVERLRLAALSEGLHAQPVRLDSLEFLHALLEVPRTHSAVALVCLGKARQTQAPTADALDIDTLCLPDRANRSLLRLGDDPSAPEAPLQQPHAPLQAFVSDKRLPIDVIRASAEFHTCEDIDSVFEYVTDEMHRFISFDRSSVAFLDRRDNTVRLRYVRSSEGSIVGENALIPLDESNVIGWVMLNRSGLLRNDIATEQHFDEQMRTEELRSDMIVPMAVGASIYGTLNVGSRKPNAFRSVDFELLRELGRLAGAAVHRLLEDSGPDEAGRRSPSLSA